MLSHLYPILEILHKETLALEREMGGVVLVIIAASLLMGCTNLGLAQKESGVMHVGGKVY
jgi:hypothetical protein